MAKKKSSGRTKRNQYDDYLMVAYKKTCRDVAILGFEFATEERQHQFRANVIASNENANALRAIAESFDGSEYRVILDEEI